MTSYWADRAWLGREAHRVLVRVDGERVAAVEEGAEPPGDAIRLPGMLLPGLANAHSHAFHRALRAAAEGAGPTFWEWRAAMYELAGRLRPDSYRRLARAVYAEMALAGITVVGEFHYLHHQEDGRPYDDPNEMGEALIAAAGEAGIRITLLDACYLQGGPGRPLEGAQARFGDGDAERWAARVTALRDAPHARVGAAIHSVRAVDPPAMREVATWARERQVPLHMHLLERREELSASPVELAQETGVLAPGSTMVHATHVPDFGVLERTGASVCVCRTTERFLADGMIGRLPALPLSFGTDSHAAVDLFEEARALELDERTRSGERGAYQAGRLLEAATAGGYAALGWEGGRLAPGMLADFIAVDMDGVHTAGSGPPEAALVFAATAADVTDVVVGGRHVVRGGRHALVEDVGRELKEAIATL